MADFRSIGLPCSNLRKAAAPEGAVLRARLALTFHFNFSFRRAGRVQRIPDGNENVG
jgi:hypothetical protein